MVAKTVRWSKSLCFVVLVFIFLVQITLIRDTSTWTVKLKRMLPLSQWDDSGSGRITCDRSHKDFDLCIVNSSALLDHGSSTLFTLGPHKMAQPNFSVKIHPYPRKNDKLAMSYVKEITLTSAPPKSTCGITHHNPALVFSAGGYTGNFFHDLNENFIPLFITINSLFPNQDVVLVVTDGRIWWFQKYEQLLYAFNHHHHIINMNNLTTTHCFPSTIIGLIKHGPMIIDPKLLPDPKTLIDFHAFLKDTYNKDDTPLYHPKPIRGRPSLILLSRRGNVSRVILNEEEIIEEAEEIGFNVHLLEPSKNTSVANSYKLIHTSHALLGVHGAGLTHYLFLRPGSVLVQIVPIGTEWPSRTYFEKPSRTLGLEYIEYKIEANESSLAETYGANSLVIKDPIAYQENKWAKTRIYLKKQNVKLDVIRFRKCLIQAYKKAKKFMDIVS